jgi:hypothetical protein
MAPPVVSSIEAKMEIIGIALIIFVLWIMVAWAADGTKDDSHLFIEITKGYQRAYDLERVMQLIADTTNDDDTRMQAQDALKKIGAIK